MIDLYLHKTHISISHSAGTYLQSPASLPDLDSGFKPTGWTLMRYICARRFRVDSSETNGLRDRESGRHGQWTVQGITHSVDIDRTGNLSHEHSITLIHSLALRQDGNAVFLMETQFHGIYTREVLCQSLPNEPHAPS